MKRGPALAAAGYAYGIILFARALSANFRKVDMKVRSTAVGLLVGGLALMPAAQAAQGRTVCDTVKRETVTEYFGSITKTDISPGSCVFTTNWNGRIGIFHVTKHGPLGDSDYRLMTTRTGDDEFVDVAGIGEKAIINVTTEEMVLRTAGIVYALSTRGMPCERLGFRDPGRQEEKEKCDIKRIEALKLFGAQIAR